MKIKDLKYHSVVWTKSSKILGIVGADMKKKYNELEVIKKDKDDYELVDESIDIDIDDVVTGLFIC